MSRPLRVFDTLRYVVRMDKDTYGSSDECPIHFVRSGDVLTFYALLARRVPFELSTTPQVCSVLFVVGEIVLWVFGNAVASGGPLTDEDWWSQAERPEPRAQDVLRHRFQRTSRNGKRMFFIVLCIIPKYSISLKKVVQRSSSGPGFWKCSTNFS